MSNSKLCKKSSKKESLQIQNQQSYKKSDLIRLWEKMKKNNKVVQKSKEIQPEKQKISQKLASKQKQSKIDHFFKKKSQLNSFMRQNHTTISYFHKKDRVSLSEEVVEIQQEETHKDTKTKLIKKDFKKPCPLDNKQTKRSMQFFKKSSKVTEQIHSFSHKQKDQNYTNSFQKVNVIDLTELCESQEFYVINSSKENILVEEESCEMVQMEQQSFPSEIYLSSSISQNLAKNQQINVQGKIIPNFQSYQYISSNHSSLSQQPQIQRPQQPYIQPFQLYQIQLSQQVQIQRQLSLAVQKIFISHKGMQTTKIQILRLQEKNCQKYCWVNQAGSDVPKLYKESQLQQYYYDELIKFYQKHSILTVGRFNTREQYQWL